MRPFILWVGVPAAAVTGGIVWASLLNAIGPTYVWSIAVVLIGAYYWYRARTQSDRTTTLFITAAVLGILLAAGILNAAG
jgi:membrane protein implicated in regulation of membrane protease activity